MCPSGVSASAVAISTTRRLIAALCRSDVDLTANFRTPISESPSSLERISSETSGGNHSAEAATATRTSGRELSAAESSASWARSDSIRLRACAARAASHASSSSSSSVSDRPRRRRCPRRCSRSARWRAELLAQFGDGHGHGSSFDRALSPAPVPRSAVNRMTWRACRRRFGQQLDAQGSPLALAGVGEVARQHRGPIAGRDSRPPPVNEPEPVPHRLCVGGSL